MGVSRFFGWLSLVTGALLVVSSAMDSTACCPAPRSGQPVVNADQTVILIWDAARGVQHFIRKANFRADAEDFGFLVPTPSIPELEESGNDAFPYLQRLTEPKVEVQRRKRGGGCGCGASSKGGGDKADLARAGVVVVAEKEVAGFNAKVLEAKSAEALTAWLKEHGYAFSPEVQAWAEPYIAGGWMITALRVAKAKDSATPGKVAAAALRISFKTDRPLFPYREPDPTAFARALGSEKRLLRIYFIAEARYRGDLTRETPWTGKVAWANKLSAEQRQEAVKLLGLRDDTVPADWFMTEFEDDWPYRAAPADVYFSKDVNQDAVSRPPIIRFVAAPWPNDVAGCAIAALLFAPLVARRFRRRPSAA